MKSGISSRTKFTVNRYDERCLISDGDVLFSWSGSPDTSIDTFIWCDGRGWLNQHIFKVVCDHGFGRAFVFSLLKQFKDVFISLAKTKQTTGLGHVTVKDLKKEVFPAPPPGLRGAFEGAAGHLQGRLIASRLESRTLAELRDLLLPKLLSGQIRVGQAEKLVEEAV